MLHLARSWLYPEGSFRLDALASWVKAKRGRFAYSQNASCFGPKTRDVRVHRIEDFCAHIDKGLGVR
jgi:hypothetical protein